MKAERMPSRVFTVDERTTDPNALHYVETHAQEREIAPRRARGHKESLARLEGEGDGLDVYRRTVPDHLPPFQDLTTIFNRPHWRH